MKYSYLQLKFSKLEVFLPICGFLFAFFAYTFLIKEISSPILGEILGFKSRTSSTVLFKSTYSLMGLFLSIFLAIFLVKKNESFLFNSSEEKIESRVPHILQFSCGSILYLLTIPFTSLSNLKFSFISDSSQGYIVVLLFFLIFQLERRKIELLFLFNAVVGPISLYLLFRIYTNAAPLFTDDHGSVIYRLALLKENFPFIPIYNTEWNGGMDWRDFFATGILNVFLIFSPILYLFDVLTAYRMIPPTLLIILLPLATYKASMILSNCKQTGLIASALAICSSSIWYRWGLSYGSLGFVCSACLFSLSSLLLLKCLKENEKVSIKQIFFTIIIVTLSIQWSALILALIPVVLIYIFNFKLIINSRRLLMLCLSLIVINLPWLITFVKVSNVLSFVETTESEIKRTDITKVSKTKQEAVSEGVIRTTQIENEVKKINSRMREFGSKVNPLLFVLILPSLFLFKIKQKDYFVEIVFICSWLFLFGLIGPSVKPQLELERMLVLLSLFLSIPVSILVTTVINRLSSDTFLHKLTLSTLTVWGILGFFVVGSILQNKAWDKFVTWPNSAQIFKDRVLQNYNGGRLLFSGFVLHEFEGGHIAYLSKLLNIPIVASSPVHNLWQYKDVMPGSFFNSGIAGVESFMDLYNASVLAAHEKKWKDYFRAQPNYYSETGRAGQFVIFKRINFVNNYFISGEGDILSQNSSGLTLKINSKDAVIKFKYYDFLQVKGCEVISPYKVENYNELVFISLKNCNLDTIITIESKSVFKRVLGL